LEQKNRTQTISWCFYDFGNSAFTTLVVTFIYSTYFTQAIAPDEITGTLLWSRGISISAILIALLSPILGAIADQTGLRRRMLISTTLISVAATFLLYYPTEGMIREALILFVVGNVCFELGSVFYNSYLPEIAPQEKVGRISGYGWSFGYVGGLLAMFIAMVGFVNPETPWFGLARDGEHIRATNILVAGWFAVFSLPLFFSVREVPKKGRGSLGKVINDSFIQLKDTYQHISNYRQIVRLLIARLVYNDGLVTIFAFGAIYAAGTFDFTFEEIMIFGVVLNVTAGLGAFLMGFFDDRLGGRNTIIVSLFGLIVATLGAVAAPNKTFFWASGILVGIFAGPNQSASRSLMARFIPKANTNEFFGFFAFSGKLTSFLGPLLLGIFTSTFGSQRMGVSVILVFFVFGLWLIYRVDEEEGKRLAMISTSVS
jgi:UMF1 family MFS transporter